jgi:hypothetical protein
MTGLFRKKLIQAIIPAHQVLLDHLTMVNGKLG